MNQVTPILKFSRDPLSITSPTYIDITTDFISAEWADGKAKDLDEPQAGRARFTLRNTGRRFEPEYAAGVFYPDIVPLRRFKFQVVADGVTYDEGIWYAQAYTVVYPDPAADYSRVIVDCVDGFGLLSLDSLDFMDPPDAQSYDEVVNFDAPSFYYRLGEPAGTKTVSHVRFKRLRGRKYKYGIYLKRFTVGGPRTIAEIEGQSGPAGTYKNTPTLGEPGLITGDIDTSIRFTRSLSQYAVVGPLDQADLIASNQLTLEAWVKPSTFTGGSEHHIMDGPFSTSVGSHVFLFWVDGTSHAVKLEVKSGAGASTLVTSSGALSTGTVYHVVASWDGSTARVYINGALDNSSFGPRMLATGDANQFFLIAAAVGAAGSGPSTLQWDGWIDEVAVYEKALSADRILAHYNAGANRGFAQQAAGTRISTIATSDLWSEAGIQTGSFQVAPRFEHGQPKLEEILETVRAEMPDNHFYFSGTGDPVYLPWNYKDGLGAEVTLGENSGEIPYTDIQLIYDDEIFNEVTTSTETGTAQTSSDATSQGAYRRRAAAETGLILVSDDNAKSISAAVLDEFKDPLFRVASVSLTGATPASRAAILARDIGDMIRVRRRQGGGTAIDVLTTVLGQSKALDVSGNLWCTWNTARGFNASLNKWRLGISGFSELGQTTTLG